VALPTFVALPLLMLLAISSLSTKAMGAAWVLFTITGLWGLWRTRQSVSASTTPNAAPWIKTWLIVTAVAMALKTVPTLYWADPWAERHGEIRLLLGAVAVWGLSRWKVLDTLTTGRIADALSLSSALGLAWVLAFGRGEVCTHPIPWAVSMAMVSGWLLHQGLSDKALRPQRQRWLLGGLLGLLAVLASQSRGAFGIVLWWGVALLHHAWQQRQHAPSHQRLLRQAGLAATVLIGTVWVLSYTPVLQRPMQSLHDAVEQITVSRQSAEAGSNSSVGSRLYMWQKSQEAITESPWIGHGHNGRKQALASWAAQANSHEVSRLGHLHNELLNQLIDHGLWGLASQLAYIVGLLVMALQLLRAQQKTAAMAIGCVCFMHLSSSMSNVNFSHNYYTTALSMMVMLSLWTANDGHKKRTARVL
jgi:O-antigen ligase